MAGTKICRVCKEEKDLAECHKSRNICKICMAAYDRERRRTKPGLLEKCNAQLRKLTEEIKSDPVRYAEHQKKRTAKRREEYLPGFTYDDYEELLRQQNGLCAICGKPETIKSKTGHVRSLAVDHCHVTGMVRGLLCFRCNTNLAILEDEKFRMLADTYLSSFKKFVD